MGLWNLWSGWTGNGYETGRMVRVRHTEFQKQIKGSRLELGIESDRDEARVFGNENGMRGSKGRSSRSRLHRV